MKVKCIKDTQEIGVWKTTIEKIEGITKGKVYDAEVIPFGYLGIHADIGGDNIHFFIWDDDKEWNVFDTFLFEPVDQIFK
jgi:hypothetical protein